MNEILLIFSIVLLSACNGSYTTDSENNFTIIDSVEFKTGMSTSEYHSGRFYDMVTEKEYIFFENYKTDKKVKVFDHKGKLHTIVPLTNLLNEEVEINKLEVFNFDTIFVLEAYTNNFYWLNRRGEVWKKGEFIEGYDDSLISPVYFSTFVSSMRVGSNSLLLNREISPTQKLIDLGESPDENNRVLMSKFWNSSQYIIADDIFSDSVTARQEEFSLYKELFPNDSTSVYIEFPRQYIKGEELLVGSKFSNQVFELDLQSFERKRVLKVESDYTEIGMTPFTDEEDRLMMASELEDKRNVTSGKITNIVWNEYLEHIYVEVFHETESNAPEVLESRPWSLLIYNNEFEKIKELKFRKNIYNGMLLPTPKGFLLQKKVDFKSYKEQKVLLHEIAYQ